MVEFILWVLAAPFIFVAIFWFTLGLILVGTLLLAESIEALNWIIQWLTSSLSTYRG